ncbi:unnamed protein product [Bemisia tabaci]|uniref:Ionotropic receptor n=1 Tax=Bemisia tabaci TaxID=7038 RepID=A0A9P0AL50_BEMTA|nr:unnamed protein product [Bemisia tabaci]
MTLKFEQASPDDSSLNNLVSLCTRTAELSKQQFFYIINLVPAFSPAPLIKILHENLLATAVINPFGDFFSSSGRAKKNMLFFLESLDDILSLILGTANDGSRQRMDKKNGGSAFMNFTGHGLGRKIEGTTTRKLPRYCVQLDAKLHPTCGKACNITCDFVVNMTSVDIFVAPDADSDIFPSDHVLTYSHGLYVHNIWSPDNYLIFVVAEKIIETVTSEAYLDRLKLSFAFMWRFFKGRKTIICIGHECFKYDPFQEQLSRYTIPQNDKNDDFKLNFNHMRINYVFEHKVDGTTDDLLSQQAWYDILHLALFEIGARNGEGLPVSIVIKGLKNSTLCSNDFELLQKSNADIYLTDGISVLEGDDISDFHFTTGIETNALCFVTPPSDYVPQYLVVFKVFSVLLWSLILMTVILFIGLQSFFQYSQYRTFRHLHTEKTAHTYEVTSSLIIVWSYFMNGSPYRLLLGKMYSGKLVFILLTIFSFVIGIVYQSEMFNMLSGYTRYPEIKTVAELKDSDIIIQVPSKTVHEQRFNDLSISSPDFMNKFTNSFSYYVDLAITTLFEDADDNGNIEFDLQRNESKMSPKEAKFMRMTHPIRKQLISIVETDAFLLSIPRVFGATKYFFLNTKLMDRDVEVHKTDECILTYPYMYRILRSTPYFDEINGMIQSFIENGRALKILQSMVTSSRAQNSPESKSAPNLPRIFNMSDLQAAFFGLLIGLFLSCLIFSIELLTNSIREMITYRKLNRRKK